MMCNAHVFSRCKLAKLQYYISKTQEYFAFEIIYVNLLNSL